LASSDVARPAPGVRLCALGDLADPGSKGFRFRRETRLFAGFIVRTGDEVRGFVDSCPHAGWPLAALDDRYLTRTGQQILCAGHGALFDLEGLCTSGPCLGERLEPWPVQVRDGVVFTA
jgi:nitrite reductase/ring-hydroxylating ferredoxin subunit